MNNVDRNKQKLITNANYMAGGPTKRSATTTFPDQSDTPDWRNILGIAGQILC